MKQALGYQSPVMPCQLHAQDLQRSGSKANDGAAGENRHTEQAPKRAYQAYCCSERNFHHREIGNKIRIPP
ncbi:MAG: hypothetical protein V3W37_00460 [Candidatus Binatia bacterium]